MTPTPVPLSEIFIVAMGWDHLAPLFIFALCAYPLYLVLDWIGFKLTGRHL